MFLCLKSLPTVYDLMYVWIRVSDPKLMSIELPTVEIEKLQIEASTWTWVYRAATVMQPLPQTHA